MKNQKTNPVGRPTTNKETKQQKSVSILPSKLKRIEKRHGSLTKYLEAKILQDNI